jgi:hypothetical protein
MGAWADELTEIIRVKGVTIGKFGYHAGKIVKTEYAVRVNPTRIAVTIIVA